MFMGKAAKPDPPQPKPKPAPAPKRTPSKPPGVPTGTAMASLPASSCFLSHALQQAKLHVTVLHEPKVLEMQGLQWPFLRAHLDSIALLDDDHRVICNAGAKAPASAAKKQSAKKPKPQAACKPAPRSSDDDAIEVVSSDEEDTINLLSQPTPSQVNHKSITGLLSNAYPSMETKAPVQHLSCNKKNIHAAMHPFCIYSSCR